MSMLKRAIYLTYTRLDYSLNEVCIKGLRKNGVEVLEFHVENRGIPGFIKVLGFYKHNSKNTDAVVIGCDSPALAIFIRFFSRKNIIYNAVMSVYERLIISRALASQYSFKAFYYWLLDFVAVHFSNLTLVETDHQADFFKKIFKISKGKICRSYIGVNEDKFFYDSSIPKPAVFTVLFRGTLMSEAGAEYVIKAAKILENQNIKFIMHGGGLLLSEILRQIEEVKPKNLEFISAFFSYEELRKLMQGCHLSLGQLSNHPRLERTIPHKAYESLAMKLPYLSADNKGIFEILKSGETCIICEPANAESLAEKILWAKNNPQELERISENGYSLFKNKLTVEKLGRELKNRLDSLVL